MELESYFDFIDPDIIRIRGHRIDIAHVLEYYAEGYSPEVISLELPTLTLEQIHATITYYLHNRSVIDDYLTRRRVYVTDLLKKEETAPESSAIKEKIRALRNQKVHGQAA